MKNSYPVAGADKIERLLGDWFAIEVVQRSGRRCRKLKVIRRDAAILKVTIRDYDGSRFVLHVDPQANHAQLAVPYSAGDVYENLVVEQVWKSVLQLVDSRH